MARSTVNTDGTLRALFLGEDAARLRDLECQPLLGRLGQRDVFLGRQRARDDRQQRLAAAVERLDPHRPPARRDHHRRIDGGGVPARVAAGIFVVRREHRAAPAVQPVDIGLDGAGIGHVMALPRDRHAACRDEPFRAVFKLFDRHSRLHLSPREGPVGFREKTNGRPDQSCGHLIFTRTRFGRPLSAGPPPNLLDRSRMHGDSNSGEWQTAQLDLRSAGDRTPAARCKYFRASLASLYDDHNLNMVSPPGESGPKSDGDCNEFQNWSGRRPGDGCFLGHRRGLCRAACRSWL